MDVIDIMALSDIVTPENLALALVLGALGFAHGFATLSDYCEVQYKQTAFYEPETEGGIAWNDPDVGVGSPLDNRR